jgi:hypothetical protein
MVWGGVDGTPGEQSDQEYAYRIAHVIRRVAWDEGYQPLANWRKDIRADRTNNRFQIN